MHGAPSARDGGGGGNGGQAELVVGVSSPLSLVVPAPVGGGQYPLLLGTLRGEERKELGGASG